jgi:hypothetical protein
MTSRQLRRAEERRLRKLARKGLHQPAPAAYQAVPEQLAPGPTAPANIPIAPATTQSPRTRAEINRENARHSTGPKTIEGKATSSRNAFKHGFSAAFAVLPSENQNAFDELLAALRAEHQPAGPTEEILVERMAQHYWLSQRAIRLQDAALSDGRSPSEQEKSLALYLRYQTANDRAFSQCLGDLLKLKAAALKQQREASKKMRDVAGSKETGATLRADSAESISDRSGSSASFSNTTPQWQLKADS